MKKTDAQSTVIKPNPCAAPYRVPVSSFLWFIISQTRESGTFVIGVLLLIGAGIILGISVDVRFAIIAMMLLFIILPMMTAMIFFIYGLKEVNALNQTLHRIRVLSDGSLEIDILRPENQDKQKEDEIDDRLSSDTFRETKRDQEHNLENVPVHDLRENREKNQEENQQEHEIPGKEYQVVRSIKIEKERIKPTIIPAGSGEWKEIEWKTGREWIYIKYETSEG